MSARTKIWLPEQSDLIHMVKRYPIIYAGDFTISRKQYKANLDSVWEDISKYVRQPGKTVKRQWTDIKSTYAQLKNMINKGIISEEIVHLHTTSKYLDGSLSFLDPYLTVITEDISPAIHKRINKIFGIEYSVVHDACNDKNTLTVLNPDKTFIETGGEVQSVSNYIDMSHSMNVETTTHRDVDQRVKLELESELIIENHIKIESDIDDEVTEECGNNTELILQDDEMSERNKDVTTYMNAMIVEENSTVADADLSGVSDEKVRKVFKELANVVSAELSIEKQKILRYRINALLIKTLEI